jgi:hypothetical protein
VATTSIPPKSNFKFGIISSISYATALTTMPNLRSYFRANQIDEQEGLFNQFVHLNVGFRYKRLKLITQSGRGVEIISFEPRDEGRVARQIYADYMGAMLGYDVLNGRNRRLYVNVGTGTTTYKYNVYRRSEQPVDFQDLTQYSQAGNIPSLRLTNRYIDFNLELAQREKRKRSAEVILRLGYRRGLSPQAWRSDAFALQGAPTDRINQFYFQVGYNFSSNFGKAAAL